MLHTGCRRCRTPESHWRVAILAALEVVQHAFRPLLRPSACGGAQLEHCAAPRLRVPTDTHVAGCRRNPWRRTGSRRCPQSQLPVGLDPSFWSCPLNTCSTSLGPGASLRLGGRQLINRAALIVGGQFVAATLRGYTIEIAALVEDHSARGNAARPPRPGSCRAPSPSTRPPRECSQISRRARRIAGVTEESQRVLSILVSNSELALSAGRDGLCSPVSYSKEFEDERTSLAGPENAIGAGILCGSRCLRTILSPRWGLSVSAFATAGAVGCSLTPLLG